jgi:hypothetical protein
MQALTYLAQVSLYWILLYGCYWLLLRRHTFFVWNRAYLLASLLASFALPLIEYPETAPDMSAVTYVVATLPSVVTTALPAAEAAPAVPVWLVLGCILYWGYFL